MCEIMRKRFYELLTESVNNKKDNNVYLTRERYNCTLNEVKEARSVKVKQTVHYRRLKRYDILNVGGEEKLTTPLSADKTEILYYVAFDELFDVIHESHVAIGHGGRTRMIKELNRKYKNVTCESVITYLRLCELCQRKQKTSKRGTAATPVLHEMDSRCQVDIIDMRHDPDGDEKFILLYQDRRTKFVLLRPLQSRAADEVARNLLDIFTTFGAPNILHSGDGREFSNRVIESLRKTWNDVKIVHGKSRRCEGSIRDVTNVLSTWLVKNRTTKWSVGLGFVQAMKNRTYVEDIKCTPFEATFGIPMKLGIPDSVLSRNLAMATEEDLEKATNYHGEPSGGTEIEEIGRGPPLGHDEEETCSVMENESDLRNEEIDLETFYKNSDGTIGRTELE